MTSFVQILLQTQQRALRAQREAAETAVRQAADARATAERAERLASELQAIEDAACAAAAARAEEEAAARKLERLELLRRQQHEVSDGEEIRIRTLAYSHTRDWHQPNKKCFSHRGRQLYAVCMRCGGLECLGVSRRRFGCHAYSQDVLEARAHRQSEMGALLVCLCMWVRSSTAVVNHFSPPLPPIM